MGTTFAATLITGSKLHWISVGDSPLYLFRNNKLRQINADHSLAPQIDLLVANGMMSPEDGYSHPNRNVLTSVLIGDDIPKIDCPEDPLILNAGDVLVLASDGLQTLRNDQIETILRRSKNRNTIEITDRLLNGVCAAQNPDQDNISIVVIRAVEAPKPYSFEWALPPRVKMLQVRTAGLLNAIFTRAAKANTTRR